MGIHNLFSGWISQLGRFANVTSLPPSATAVTATTATPRIQGLMIDLNEIISTAIAASSTSVPEAVLQAVASLIRRFPPRQYLIMAADGVVPMAKMAQMRSRKIRREMVQQQTDEVKQYPGSELSKSVHTAICNWIHARNTPSLPPVVCYSSHDEPGEGEHKMFSVLRGLVRTKIIRVSSDSDGIHLICGSDADLVILAMCTLPPPALNQIYVYRGDGGGTKFVAIDHVFSSAKAAMTGGSSRSSSCDDARLKQDLLILSMLLGNDFMPSTPSTYSFAQEIFAAYAATTTTTTRQRTYLSTLPNPRDDSFDISANDHEFETSPGEIDIASLAKFFDYFARNSERNLIIRSCVDECTATVTTTTRSPSVAIESGAFAPSTRSLDFELLRRNWYGGGGFTTDRVIDNYIGIMTWMFRYYTSGSTRINWEYTYDYIFAPFAVDVATRLTTASSGSAATTLDFCRANQEYVSEADGNHEWRGKTPISQTQQLQILLFPRPDPLRVFISGKRHAFLAVPILQNIGDVCKAVILATTTSVSTATAAAATATSVKIIPQRRAAILAHGLQITTVSPSTVVAARRIPTTHPPLTSQQRSGLPRRSREEDQRHRPKKKKRRKDDV